MQYFDDKDLVILGVVIIALSSMWWNGAESGSITQNVITGLFGIAVGRKTNGN